MEVGTFLAAVLLLAVVHLFSGRLRFLDTTPSTLLLLD